MMAKKIQGAVLVVDDEVGMREGCRRALGPEGYDVTTAENGAEGLRKLREGAYDLVLLDAMMPGMSGLELLERIHDHDPDIMCVMITGFATVDLAAQAMKQGAYDFLAKPFTSDELLTVVRRCLDERQRQLARRQEMAKREEALLLERAEREMAKIDAMESRFMLVVVHELRNPAGVLKNYLQLMRGGYVDTTEWDEYLEKLDLRATQLLNMLDDLLVLAQIKGSASTAKQVPVDMVSVLQEIAKGFQTAAKAKGLAFQVETRATPLVQAQAAHMRSLWTYLLDNAIRYTPQGTVEAILDQEGQELIARVRDTGIGIPVEEISRIFQEFYRSDAARAEVPLGTGLGLSIVEKIVQVYQGSVEVESAPGEGSTFVVRLPCLSSEEES
jgi:signal transduction histidine kinase